MASFRMNAIAQPGGGSEDQMRPFYTAIIHLREPATPLIRRLVLPALAAVRGVAQAEYDSAAAIISVAFDGDRARLPELVRLLEDLGAPVAGVAQRRAATAKSR